MESKEYFEKVMQDYNQNRKGRSLRKYCKDEAVDYDWLIQHKKNYPLQEKQQEPSQDAFNVVITTFGLSCREMFKTYRYGKTQLASDRKSLLCPEFGVYVRVVGKLQIEQRELW